MAEVFRDPEYLELLEAARGTIGREGAASAARSFGIDEMLAAGELDESGEAAVYAFLEAQGHQTGTSTVLARLALVDVVASGHPELADRILGELSQENTRATVVGWEPGASVVVEDPARGLIDASDGTRVEVAPPLDDTEYVVVLTTGGRGDVLVAPDEMAALRPRMTRRLLLGASAEILGALTRLIEDAAAHASTRTQFGRPLAEFPAVRTMLAWSATEVHQLRTLFDLTTRQSADDPQAALAAMVTKGLAGRAGRAVSQHTLQVSGGIGFTWEYPHHRLARRVLALESVGAFTADITGELGRLVRTTGELPDLVSL